jgi:putative endonuclease
MRSTRSRLELGQRAEALVCQYLCGRGFSIVATNVRVGHKEIDVVARRGGLLVFCEVRARSHCELVSPLETIGLKKIANVRRAAAQYLAQNDLRGVAIRFDAAAVVFDVPEGRLDYIENAF